LKKSITLLIKTLSYRFWLISSILFLSYTKSVAQQLFNGDLEEINPVSKLPTGWTLYDDELQKKAYNVSLDSLNKEHGKYAFTIENIGKGYNFGSVRYPIKRSFYGQRITLKGFIKTMDVHSGYAALYVMVNSKTKSLAFNNMEDHKVTGTSDWHEYSISVPYDEKEAQNIEVGAFLQGDGKMWVDNMRLFIDGKPIDSVNNYRSEDVVAKTFPTPKYHIDTIKINPYTIINLTLLGELWGFLKYYHPNIGDGHLNWDEELIKILPVVAKLRTAATLSDSLENWVDRLGIPANCTNCTKLTDTKDISLRPSYGDLLTNELFKSSLLQKLRIIIANRTPGRNYYVSATQSGTVEFQHEDPDFENLYPDLGHRLVALFRYWNMIQYFCPNKQQIGVKWESILREFVPLMIQARNAASYNLLVAKLVSDIHDSHAIISSQVLNQYKGANTIALRCRFIEGKLVVIGYFKDSLNLAKKIKRGDIITRINGRHVADALKKYLPITSGSNDNTRLREVVYEYLLRTNLPYMLLETNNGSRTSHFKILTMKYDGNTIQPDSSGLKNAGYTLIKPDVGYMYAAKLSNKDLPGLVLKFMHTKGMIIDLRCYPKDDIAFTLSRFIKPLTSPFVQFSIADITYPGVFKKIATYNCGNAHPLNYKGKVIILVDQYTQSAAEFTAMALQSSPNATVMGTMTAGADGETTQVVLPGGIVTRYSSAATFYPDGTSAQGKGVQINYYVGQTIKGIRANKDAQISKALELLNL
jgi:C-terminal processing protease CtpA/Prc